MVVNVLVVCLINGRTDSESVRLAGFETCDSKVGFVATLSDMLVLLVVLVISTMCDKSYTEGQRRFTSSVL